MKDYLKYIDDVRNNRVITSTYIKQQVERIENFKKRPDMYFDEDTVEKCFSFIRQMRHFAGKTAGKQFELLPWQKWVIGSVVGIKWKDTGLRVCRDLFILVARKQGKSSLIAALALYMLIADGEAAPSIGCFASSRDQARILFEMCQNYGKTLDPKGKILKQYRNYMKNVMNGGEVKVFSSDASKQDGYGFSVGILDETHSYKDNSLISVVRSSMGFREQPLLVQITTCGFLLEGYPCFETYKLGIEVLNNVKTQDDFWPFIYMMDPDDDWMDEGNWVKCNPCVGETVSYDYLRQQATLAKNDSTQIVPILTKNFNKWQQSSLQWISQEVIAKQMKPINLEDYRGKYCYLAVDLSSVGDFTSLSLMIPEDDKFIYKSWTFLPNETYKEHKQKALYDRFVNEGSMIITEGNTVDYDFIMAKIAELNQMFQIEGIYFDSWNSTYFNIKCTELGYNMIPVSQAVGSFNAPTKEVERAARNGKLVIDKSSNVLWQFGNVSLKVDANNNIKPSKDNYDKKIDSVISMIMCMAGYMKNPLNDDFSIFVIN